MVQSQMFFLLHRTSNLQGKLPQEYYREYQVPVHCVSILRMQCICCGSPFVKRLQEMHPSNPPLTQSTKHFSFQIPPKHGKLLWVADRNNHRHFLAKFSPTDRQMLNNLAQDLFHNSTSIHYTREQKLPLHDGVWLVECRGLFSIFLQPFISLTDGSQSKIKSMAQAVLGITPPLRSRRLRRHITNCSAVTFSRSKICSHIRLIYLANCAPQQLNNVSSSVSHFWTKLSLLKFLDFSWCFMCSPRKWLVLPCFISITNTVQYLKFPPCFEVVRSGIIPSFTYTWDIKPFVPWKKSEFHQCNNLITFQTSPKVRNWEQKQNLNLNLVCK